MVSFMKHTRRAWVRFENWHKVMQTRSSRSSSSTTRPCEELSCFHSEVFREDFLGLNGRSVKKLWLTEAGMEQREMVVDLINAMSCCRCPLSQSFFTVPLCSLDQGRVLTKN